MVTGDAVSQGKPHPEPYQKAAAALGVDPEDSVAIEDSNTGARSAEAAGCTVLVVENHVPVAPGARRVFVDTLEGMTVDRPPRPGGRVVGMTGGPRVTALRRYPVKACAPEHLETASVGVDGFLHDRDLAVAVGDAVVTQREFTLLARVRPILDDATGLLRLACDGGEAVEAVVETDRRTREVTIFGARVAVVDQDPRLSEWFSDLLGAAACLVAAPPTTRRTSPGAGPGADGAVGRGHRLPALRGVAGGAEPRAGGPRTRQAARPTGSARTSSSTVSGRTRRTTYDLVEAGDVRLAFAQTDERCVGDHRRPAGRRAARSGAAAHAGDYRRLDGAGVAFGIYTAVAVPGTLRVGDPVVLDRRS